MAAITLNRSAESKARELAAVRAAAVAEVNESCGQVRLRYITDIPGQQMIYREKEDEAHRFQAAGEPADLAGFPFIAGEIASTGLTAAEVAAMFLHQAAQWREVGAALEQLRIGANEGIRLAASRAEVSAVLEDYRTSLEVFA